MKAPVYPMTQQQENAIVYFTLETLLPECHALAVNFALGTLCLLAPSNCEQPYPLLLAEQQFTTNELCVLLPLLQHSPHYCPYEVLLASFYHGNTDETAIERSRTRLNEALVAGIWDQEMRPLRNILSRTRLKMRGFSLEIASIFETGYVLMRLSERQCLAGRGRG